MTKFTAPKTIIESINFVKEKSEVSNEAIIEIYNHVHIIAVTEIWKKDSFYEGVEKEFLHLKDKKFGAFIKEVYNRSQQWYSRMEEILKLQNGKNMYLKYGHKNMVTYLGLTKSEREIVLKIAEKHPTMGFNYIAKREGIKGTSTIDKTDDSEWKNKYTNLKKEFDVLKAENAELKKKLDKIAKFMN